jgi:hypothetical protein
LFFSIVEHLRETAQRQAQLNDQTEQAVALAGKGEFVEEAGPLWQRQQELRAISEQIAKALDEQAKQQPAQAATNQDVDPKQQQQLTQITERFTKAAKLVAEGSTSMQEAAEALQPATDSSRPSPPSAQASGEEGDERSTADRPTTHQPDLDRTRTKQDEALQKLFEALTLLNPPQQNQQNQPQQDASQQSQENRQDRQQDIQQGADPSRLLQAVRDREAQRRRERDRRQRYEREPVEKDW